MKEIRKESIVKFLNNKNNLLIIVLLGVLFMVIAIPVDTAGTGGKSTSGRNDNSSYQNKNTGTGQSGWQPDGERICHGGCNGLQKEEAGNLTDGVVVNALELTDAQRAQIEDIVKRKAGIPAENIIISTVVE